MSDILKARMTNPRLKLEADAAPYPLIFATVSGADLYGFPSEDSDYDLRGTHVLPCSIIFSLDIKDETIEKSTKSADFELDLVSHDVKKFFSLLLKNNGYVLEQLYSPLVVTSTVEHDELKAIARACITSFHAKHYIGFAESQWKLFQGEDQRRIKPLLYVFRVLLTAIKLMQSGILEMNLQNLNQEHKLNYLTELIAEKQKNGERALLNDQQIQFFEQEYQRLKGKLCQAEAKTHLPKAATCRAELNDLLIRLRKKYGQL